MGEADGGTTKTRLKPESKGGGVKIVGRGKKETERLSEWSKKKISKGESHEKRRK